MAETKRFIKISLAGTFVRVVSAALLYVFTIMVTNRLGQTASGIYFFSYSAVVLVSEISRLGLDNIFLRYASLYCADGDGCAYRQLLRKCMVLIFLVGSLGSVFLYVVLALFGGELLEGSVGEVIKCMIPAIPLLACLSLVAVSLQAAGHPILSAISNSINPPLFMIVVFTAFAINGARDAAIYFVISVLFSLVVGLILISTTGMPQKQSVNPKAISELLREAFPLLIVAIMAQSINLGPTLFLGVYGGMDDAAVLVAAQKVALAVSFVLVAVNSVVAPKYAVMYQEGRMDSIRVLSNRSILIMLLISLPIVSGIVAFPRYIMGFFGDDFRGGASMLLLLTGAQLVNLLCGSVGILLSMSGHQESLRRAITYSSLVSLLLLWGLTSSIGLWGAVVGSAVGVVLQNLALSLCVREKLGFFPILFWTKRRIVAS